jgi:hypothetical protein
MHNRGLSLILVALTPSRCRLSWRDGSNPLVAKDFPLFRLSGANGCKPAAVDNLERLCLQRDRADRWSGVATGASQNPEDASEPNSVPRDRRAREEHPPGPCWVGSLFARCPRQRDICRADVNVALPSSSMTVWTNDDSQALIS